MQKPELEKATKKYIAAMQDTEEYQNYCRMKEAAKADPTLWQQICD